MMACSPAIFGSVTAVMIRAWERRSKNDRSVLGHSKTLHWNRANRSCGQAGRRRWRSLDMSKRIHVFGAVAAVLLIAFGCAKEGETTKPAEKTSLKEATVSK